MPPKKDPAVGASLTASSGGRNINGKSATDADLKFIDSIFSNLISRPDVDWEAVTSTLGLKDTKCTKERWRQIKNKFSWDDDRSAASTPKSKITKRTPRSTKKANILYSTPQAKRRGPSPAEEVVSDVEKGSMTPETGSVNVKQIIDTREDMETPEANSADAASGDPAVSQPPRPRKKLPNHRPLNFAAGQEEAEIKVEVQTDGDAGIV
jgi:hypothetical protein